MERGMGAEKTNGGIQLKLEAQSIYIKFESILNYRGNWY